MRTTMTTKDIRGISTWLYIICFFIHIVSNKHDTTQLTSESNLTTPNSTLRFMSSSLLIIVSSRRFSSSNGFNSSPFNSSITHSTFSVDSSSALLAGARMGIIIVCGCNTMSTRPYPMSECTVEYHKVSHPWVGHFFARLSFGVGHLMIFTMVEARGLRRVGQFHWLG